MNTAPVSADTLQRELNAAKAAAATLRSKLPDLTTLRAAVAHHTAGAVIDPDTRPALESALSQLKAGVTLHNDYVQASRKVDDLVVQIGNAEHAQRMRRIELANNALEIANAAYLDLGKQLVRAYRRLLTQQRISQQVPGARTTIAEGFDFEPLVPSGWQGTVSQIMKDGNLPFETNELALAVELEKAVA